VGRAKVLIGGNLTLPVGLDPSSVNELRECV
jgi:hypothetical protein